MLYKSLALLVTHLVASTAYHIPPPSSSNPADNVDVFFGTQNGGNVFPGASRPFGMVKMGVDVVDSASGNAYSGYAADGNIYGISMMHESGTGGAPEYGVVSQLPAIGDLDLTKIVEFPRLANTSDEGSPGFYKTFLSNGVNVSVGAAERSGAYEYSFPDTEELYAIIVNVTHHLTAPARPWWTQYFLNGSVEASEDLKSYSGQSTIEGGWGEQGAWSIYFYGEFENTPVSVTSFKAQSSTDNSSTASTVNEDESAGLVFKFDPTESNTIKSRVGISFISIEQAKENLYNEQSSDFDVEKLKQESEESWIKEILGKVEVESNNQTLIDLVYTALYGTFLLPSNRTGENPNWESSEPYYDDWFTIWDIFRSTLPLFNVISRERSAEMVRALIDIYRHDGWMPDGRSANQNGRTQGGSNADLFLGDAFVKGIYEGINWEDGYAAMVKDAEVTPPYVYDSFSDDANTKEGRGGLSDWKSLGYISRSFNRSVTRTVEYAYDDYALSVVARGLGRIDDYIKYLKRSSNWQNLWNFEATSSEVSYEGFIQPKYANGSWAYDNYDPVSCGACYWYSDEYEASAIEYSWATPHDIETLFSFIGDDQTVIKRLDDMFELHGKGFANIGNEPSFLTPYLYNYANVQYKTVETVRYLMNNNFSVGAKALPGNSDAGAMQSWIFWALIGIYPVTSTTTYLLGAPFLDKITLNLENGKQVQIIADNLSETSFYVQSIEINGQPWNQNWFSHDTIFTNGGTIRFTLGTEPVQWESGLVPPSPGHFDLSDI